MSLFDVSVKINENSLLYYIVCNCLCGQFRVIHFLYIHLIIHLYVHMYVQVCISQRGQHAAPARLGARGSLCLSGLFLVGLSKASSPSDGKHIASI